MYKFRCKFIHASHDYQFWREQEERRNHRAQSSENERSNDESSDEDDEELKEAEVGSAHASTHVNPGYFPQSGEAMRLDDDFEAPD